MALDPLIVVALIGAGAAVIVGILSVVGIIISGILALLLVQLKADVERVHGIVNSAAERQANKIEELKSELAALKKAAKVRGK